MTLIPSINPNISRISTPTKTDNNKPFQTHAGLKTGVANSVITVGSSLAMLKLVKSGVNIANGLFKDNTIQSITSEVFNEASSDIDNILEFILKKCDKGLKGISKSMKYFLPAFTFVSVGAGYIIDKKINGKHSDLANNKIGLEDKRVEKSKNDNLYYRSNIGKKLGALIGAVSLPVLTVVCNLATKKPVNFKRLLVDASFGALSGFEFGATVDFFANKSAKKHAEKNLVVNS